MSLIFYILVGYSYKFISQHRLLLFSKYNWIVIGRKFVHRGRRLVRDLWALDHVN